MEPIYIVKDGENYFLEQGDKRVQLKWAKGQEGKTLRLPKNDSNRKKFSVSKMNGEDMVELTFKPQNTEPREFSLISKKLLKYATPEQLEAIERITAAAKEAYEADKASHSSGRAPKEVSVEVATEMLPKLEKKYAALGARIERYKEIIANGGNN